MRVSVNIISVASVIVNNNVMSASLSDYYMFKPLDSDCRAVGTEGDARAPPPPP